MNRDQAEAMCYRGEAMLSVHVARAKQAQVEMMCSLAKARLTVKVTCAPGQRDRGRFSVAEHGPSVLEHCQ